MADIQTLVPVTAGTLSWAEPRPDRRYVALLLGVTALAFAGGFVLASGPQSADAVRDAGPDLTRLLRAMAAIKLSLAGLGVWLASLRLRLPVTRFRAAGYVVAAAAMAVGPGLIWGMSHVALGAAALHGGLVAMAVVAWTDRGTGPALSAWVARRRESIAAAPISR